MVIPEHIKLLESAVRSAAVTTDPVRNKGYRGAHVIINITDDTGTSITPTIQGYNPTTDSWYDILVSTALNTTGTTVMKVYPGIAAVANGAASDFLPFLWRVSVAVGAADNLTYSIAANTMP